MTSESPPPEGDDKEISVVIRALREADLRLAELTAGEVDTVSDREGRPYLLQHAQDKLRGAEAAKQAAILDALPAHIVLLDIQGFIVSANATWRRAVPGNVLQGLPTISASTTWKYATTCAASIPPTPTAPRPASAPCWRGRPIDSPWNIPAVRTTSGAGSY